MTHYRKCSKCGFREPVAWRGSAYDPDREFADFEEFRNAYPASNATIWLVNGHLGIKHAIIEGDYVYWRSSGSNQHMIQRVPIEVYRANGNKCVVAKSVEKPTINRRLGRRAIS